MSTEYTNDNFLNPGNSHVFQNFACLYVYDKKINQLDSKYIKVLNYFLKMPGNTAYNFYKCYKNQFKSPRTPRYTKYLSEE